MFLFAVAAPLFGQTDRRVGKIRDIAQEADRLVAEADRDGETASVFVSELVVNRGNGSYPAVGTFGVKVRFYYTYGDRERNPYPDRLVKVFTETRRAARVERGEYLFDRSGRLVFYYGDDGESKIRIYFDGVKAFRAQAGEKVVGVGTVAGTARRVLADGHRLARVFADSNAF